jgi:hypothetical protein
MILTTSQYNNISMFPQVYSVGQPLLLGVRLQAENNITPTYCTITDDSTNVSIRNLEMLSPEPNISCIDLAPFISSFYNCNTAIFHIDEMENPKKIVIQLENSAEEQPLYNISSIYAAPRSVDFGGDITVVGYYQMTTQATGKPVGLFQSDVLYNDLSNLYVPDSLVVKHSQNVTTFNSDYTIHSEVQENLIGLNHTTVDIVKGGDKVIGTRNIIRKAFCRKHNLMVAYLNRYGYFEYFIFDANFGHKIEWTKNQQFNNKLINNVYQTNTIYTGGEKTDTYSASVYINDEDYLGKFEDLLRSNRVYLFDNSKENAITTIYWQPVTIESPSVYLLSKKNNMGRYTVSISLKNNYIW